MAPANVLPRAASTLMLALAALASTQPAHADDLIDQFFPLEMQVDLAYPKTPYDVPTLGTDYVRQTFVPQSDSLDFVTLYSGRPGHGLPTDVNLSILRGSELLGVTVRTIQIPADANAGQRNRFLFDKPVPLVPGEPYTLQAWVPFDKPSASFWGDARGGYDAGSLSTSRDRFPLADLHFNEGRRNAKQCGIPGEPPCVSDPQHAYVEKSYGADGVFTTWRFNPVVPASSAIIDTDDNWSRWRFDRREVGVQVRNEEADTQFNYHVLTADHYIFSAEEDADVVVHLVADGSVAGKAHVIGSFFFANGVNTFVELMSDAGAAEHEFDLFGSTTLHLKEGETTLDGSLRVLAMLDGEAMLLAGNSFRVEFELPDGVTLASLNGWGVTPVPEPSTAWLLALGGLLLGAARHGRPAQASTCPSGSSA